MGDGAIVAARCSAQSPRPVCCGDEAGEFGDRRGACESYAPKGAISHHGRSVHVTMASNNLIAASYHLA
ncbi:short-chain dehydrogenase/reductase SDR [Methylocaldum marinum]|uniref:Short-chain dehydrogenase/reductase SDR n=1 Tax=Methylocaldum marinum TaxID=1432792 RepID=A0A250KU70_9GAMM|nr:short-chain dehydrogenase/reductase SDR [Methylocaldum marinum]